MSVGAGPARCHSEEPATRNLKLYAANPGRRTPPWRGAEGMPRWWWTGILDSGSGAGMTGWGAGLGMTVGVGCTSTPARPFPLRGPQDERTGCPPLPPSRTSGRGQDERTGCPGDEWAGYALPPTRHPRGGGGLKSMPPSSVLPPTPPPARSPFESPQDERTGCCPGDEWAGYALPPTRHPRGGGGLKSMPPSKVLPPTPSAHPFPLREPQGGPFAFPQDGLWTNAGCCPLIP